MIKAFFKNVGEIFAIFLPSKNGFLMIKTFKNRGAMYKRKKVLTNENKKIIIGLEIK